jgi:hypothetical protein
MSLAKELAKLKAALDAPWPEETWKAKAEIAERELSATKDEYCKTAFALTEYTGRAEKAEAEVARLKEELQLARLAPSPEEAPPKIQVIREKMSPEKAEEVRKIRHAYLKSVERDDFLTQENAHLRAVIKTLLWFTEPHPLDLDDINLWDKIESIYGPAEGILELADFTEKEAK